jgi:hypothetical protein
MPALARAARLGGAALLVACSAAVLAPAALPAAPAGALTPAAPVTDVSVMGDSTVLGLTYNPSAGRNSDATSVISAHYHLLYEAASCRSLIGPSCGSNPPTTVLQEMQSHAGQLGQVLVIMGGYDDPDIRPGVDAIVAEAARQGVGTVLWLTYRTNVTYTFGANYVRFNGYLQQKAQQYGSLVIADWNAYSANHPEWMIPDGVHVNATGAFALANFIVDQISTRTPARCAGTTDGDSAPAPAAVPTVKAPPSRLTAMTPKRVLDTRAEDGDAFDFPLGGGSAMKVPLGAKGSTAAIVNLTAVLPCGAGYLTAYACGSGPPLASNVNYPSRRTTATAATVMLDADGNFCLYSYSTTDVIIDLFGLYGATGSGYTPVTPSRFVDTRAGATSALHGSLAANTPVKFKVAGLNGVPSTATAVSFNLTAIAPQTDAFVAAYPCTASPPLVSNVNAPAGSIVANDVVVALDSTGSVCMVASAPTDVAVDVTGSFGTGGDDYVAQTPTRLLDTRTTSELRAGASAPVKIPTGTAAALTVTAAGPGGAGYLTVAPCGTVPLASALNYVPGDLVSNLAASGADANGNVCVSTFAATDVVVDVNGVWT